MADVGVSASKQIVDAVAGRQRRGESLRQLVREEIVRVLHEADRRGPAIRRRPGTPRVVLIVGVNGTGKTTTIGKLANQLKREGLDAAHLRRGHVPRGRGRSAAGVGRSGRGGHGPRARRVPIPRRWCSTR